MASIFESQKRKGVGNVVKYKNDKGDTRDTPIPWQEKTGIGCNGFVVFCDLQDKLSQ
jgi:hypothetical protein